MRPGALLKPYKAYASVVNDSVDDSVDNVIWIILFVRLVRWIYGTHISFVRIVRVVRSAHLSRGRPVAEVARRVHR